VRQLAAPSLRLLAAGMRVQPVTQSTALPLCHSPHENGFTESRAVISSRRSCRASSTVLFDARKRLVLFRDRTVDCEFTNRYVASQIIIFRAGWYLPR